MEDCTIILMFMKFKVKYIHLAQHYNSNIFCCFFLFDIQKWKRINLHNTKRIPVKSFKNTNERTFLDKNEFKNKQVDYNNKELIIMLNCVFGSTYGEQDHKFL